MEQLSLFAQEIEQNAPLASRLRPESLDDYIGQEHLVGKGKILRQMLDTDRISSMIFWGPPGVGKTTLARIIAHRTRAAFIDFSAVTSGIKEIKDVMKQAEGGIWFSHYLNSPPSPATWQWLSKKMWPAAI